MLLCRRCRNLLLMTECTFRIRFIVVSSNDSRFCICISFSHSKLLPFSMFARSFVTRTYFLLITDFDKFQVLTTLSTFCTLLFRLFSPRPLRTLLTAVVCMLNLCQLLVLSSLDRLLRFFLLISLLFSHFVLFYFILLLYSPFASVCAVLFNDRRVRWCAWALAAAAEHTIHVSESVQKYCGRLHSMSLAHTRPP